MKSSACRGSSTENSRPKYSAKCAQIIRASTSVLFAFFAARNSMLLRSMLSDCRSERGNMRAPSFFEGLLFFEGEQRDVHVGVEVRLVGVTVVLVVLVDPPLAAQAEQQVAEGECEPVVLPGGAEGELPVPKIVGEEAELDEYEGQVSGVQELEPGIAQD